MEAAWLDLVNSEWYDGYGRLEDRLDNDRWLARFLFRWRFPRRGMSSPEARAALRKLRSSLRRMVERTSAGRPPGSADLAALGEALARVPLRRRLAVSRGHYRLVLEPIRANWKWVVAQVAAAAIDALTRNDLRRVKVCANPGCRWVFYDSTRGRTRRWCKSGTCGNRDKVRRFRERQRHLSEVGE